MPLLPLLAIALMLGSAGARAAQPVGPGAQTPDIHIVYMGGDDCPPCVAWRKAELPKLQQTAAFRRVQFSWVAKPIPSAVPARFFLPEAVKPYKEALDTASAGRTGSPHFALLVNGRVYDYYIGTRPAASMENMIQSVLSGEPYPFDRCLRLSPRRGQPCADPA